jgi:hypothetical protein
VSGLIFTSRIVTFCIFCIVFYSFGPVDCSLALVFAAVSSSAFFSPVAAPAALASSSQDRMCFRFRRSMEAEVLTSVFNSMATAPMPTMVTTKFDNAMCWWGVSRGVNQRSPRVYSWVESGAPRWYQFMGMHRPIHACNTPNIEYGL